MAIQMRRGNEADLNISQLRPGELAVCLDTNKLIVKLSGENYLTLMDGADYAPIIHSHSPVSEDAAGFMTPSQVIKLDGVNAGTKVLLYSGNAVNLINATNQELDLGSDVDLSNYSAIEIRYLQYSATINNAATNYYATLRATNAGGAYGNVPAVKYSGAAGNIRCNICLLAFAGSKIKLVDAGGATQFYISTVIGYK